MTCPNEQTLAAYCEAKLPAAERATLEQHIASCPECRMVVSELARGPERIGTSTVIGYDGAAPRPAAVASGSGFAIGATLADRYRVVRFAGSGGMGEVYEVEDLELGVHVALKTILPELGVTPRMLERFKREIYVARKVTHPNVCRLFDVGYHVLANGTRVAFLTMELLDGHSLRDHVIAVERFSIEEALPLVRQMVAGLSAAHDAGVVHRDFKSGNVMIVGDRGQAQRVVIMDFGLARSEGGDRKPGYESSSEGFAGSPAYMAPEQVAGQPIGPAADIYALGVVLFELVTGKWPFEAETATLMAIKRLTEAPASPRKYVPELDERWERAILRCLSLEPQDRPASARAVLAELEAAGPIASTAARVPEPRSREATPAKGRKLALGPVIGAAIAVVIGLVGYALTQAHSIAIEVRHSSAPVAAVPRDAAAAPPVAAAPSRREVSLAFEVEPPGAEVRIDGVLLKDTGDVRRVVDDVPHGIEVSAPGFRTERVTTRLDRDQTISLKLRPLHKKPAAKHADPSGIITDYPE